MKEYILKITTKSPLHLGNGQEGILVDAEVAHDELGIPYFPAKRLKGLLYESALEITEMFGSGSKELFLLFGKAQSDNEVCRDSIIRVEDLHIPGYAQKRKQWLYLKKKYKGVFDDKAVLETFTQLRYQTAIDIETGTAQDGSLHNMRVVDADTCFEGKLYVATENKQCLELLTQAVDNLRYAGAKRNRGCGRIQCSLKPVNGGDQSAKA